MILINTTFYVDASVDAEFHTWVREHYFPCALAEDAFARPFFARLMLEQQEGMTGYAVQICAPTHEAAIQWHDGPAASLRGDLSRRFGQRILFFTTYMEEISL